MTADGAMITNYAAATGYWGVASADYAKRYTVSYNATAGVLISCPVIGVTKLVTPTMLAASQTATYTVCVVNNALNATAWNLVVSDKLPDNMGWVNPSLVSWAPVGTTWKLEQSQVGVVWLVGEPPNASTSPWFLRWTVDKLGPNRSACVTFRMTVL